MILYLLLKIIIFVLSAIAEVFGSLIPSFPDTITAILDSLSTMLSGGISFVSYFFNSTIVVGLITLVIAWHGFRVVKNAIMAVLGHFLGN